MENWFQIGDRNVRREVWSSAPINAHPDDIKAAAPLGCMIAVVSAEPGAAQGEEDNVKCVLKIYNGTCTLVTSVKWYVSFDNVLAMHWTDALELVTVFTNGCVRVYSAHGELLRSFYLHSYGGASSSRMDPGLVVHKMWADGLVYVNFENQRMYFQRAFEAQNSWLLDLGEFALTVTALGVVPNRSWSEVLVVVSTLNGTSYIKMDHLMKCTSLDDFNKYLLQINPCTYTHISAPPYHYSRRQRWRGDVPNGIGEAAEGLEGREAFYIGMGNSDEGLLTSLCINASTVKILWEIKIESFNNIYTLDEGILAVTMDSLNPDPPPNSEQGSSSSTPTSVLDQGEQPKQAKQPHPSHKGNNIIRLIHRAIYNVNIHNYVVAVLSDIGGGIRVFTRNSIQYLDLVTPQTELALSTDRGDVTNSLLRTFEMFKKGHEKSSESLYSIRDKLQTASRVCLAASKDQWDFDTSLLLIEFSIFSSSLSAPSSSITGSSNIGHNNLNSGDAGALRGGRLARDRRLEAMDAEAHDKEHVVIICYLRLCRDLVNYNVFSNINQLLLFGLDRLIVLLTNLKLYLLSIRICEFFRINPTTVLLGWITTRIKLGSHLTDSELFSLITSRLEKYLGTVLSFSKVAQVVFKQGREVLALSFIEREKCPYRQFRVLIGWNELARAAKVANECGDPTLINYIILRTVNKNDVSNILTLSKEYHLVRSMFVQQQCLSANENLLQVFYERSNSLFEAGLNSIGIYNGLVRNRDREKQSEPGRHRGRDDLLKEMKYSLNYSNGYFGNKSTADVMFWYEAVANEMLLLEHQAGLERNYEALKSVGLVGRSAMETIYELYRLNLVKEVEVIANLFKLPVNQTRCARIAALYESHNVQELLALINDKQLASVYVKGNKTYFHLLLQTLISLGANSHVESIIHSMKPAQQNYWRNFINQYNAT